MGITCSRCIAHDACYEALFLNIPCVPLYACVGTLTLRCIQIHDVITKGLLSNPR